MSNDGTCLVVADTPANAVGFGRPGTGRGERAGAFPQLRLARLAECGTHALTAATMGACATGETALARDLLPALGEGILVLADRNCRCGCVGRAFGWFMTAHADHGGVSLTGKVQPGALRTPVSCVRASGDLSEVDCTRRPSCSDGCKGDVRCRSR